MLAIRECFLAPRDRDGAAHRGRRSAFLPEAMAGGV